MTKTLTTKSIDALKPQAKRYEVQDLLCPGMSVRVSTRGVKVFALKFRYGCTQKRMKLGTYPRISLATAREKALDILRQLDEGIDPTKRRRTTDMKVETICREFIRLHAQPRNKSWREAERILERELVGSFGERDIREIKRFDVLELMDGAIARGSGYQAKRPKPSPTRPAPGRSPPIWRRATRSSSCRTRRCGVRCTASAPSGVG